MLSYFLGQLQLQRFKLSKGVFSSSLYAPGVLGHLGVAAFSNTTALRSPKGKKNSSSSSSSSSSESFDEEDFEEPKTKAKKPKASATDKPSRGKKKAEEDTEETKPARRSSKKDEENQEAAKPTRGKKKTDKIAEANEDTSEPTRGRKKAVQTADESELPSKPSRGKKKADKTLSEETDTKPKRTRKPKKTEEDEQDEQDEEEVSKKSKKRTKKITETSMSDEDLAPLVEKPAKSKTSKSAEEKRQQKLERVKTAAKEERPRKESPPPMSPKGLHPLAVEGFSKVDTRKWDVVRPDYPQEAIDAIRSTMEFHEKKVIFDIGSGTGRLLRQLKDYARLLAVEPIEHMRIRFIDNLPDFQVLNGSGETLPLLDKCLDALLCGSSFHWFPTHQTLMEFHRVLKPDAYLGLIWNSMDESYDWVKQLQLITTRYQKDAPRFRDNKWQKIFEDHPHYFTPFQRKTFHFKHHLDNEEMIADRIQNISFMSLLEQTEWEKVREEILDIVHTKRPKSDELFIPYQTDYFWCQKKPYEKPPEPVVPVGSESTVGPSS